MYMIITIVAMLTTYWFLMTHVVFEMVAKQPPRRKIGTYIFFAALLMFCLILFAALFIAEHFLLLNLIEGVEHKLSTVY